jgi:glycosyltransferase involved in cell wall biosynthesis
VSRILIDVTRLLYRRLKKHLPTGIDRVSLEYIRYYSDSSDGARAVLSLGPFNAVMSSADSNTLFRALPDAAAPIWPLAIRLITKAFLWRWMKLNVAGNFLFNTGHMGLEDKHYAWALRRHGARPIIVVHDLIPITHPEYCRPGERERHLTRMRCAVRISAGIVANSQHTKTVLADFCRDDNLTMPPCIVAPLAPGVSARHTDLRPIAKPYFVILGTIEPRKNHWMLLQLWRKLVETLGQDAPILVVIGQRGWECENVADLLERSAQLKGFVVELPYCSDGELVTYLHHAQALLFPSFAEGYGIPVTEALSIGVPVIASDIEVFRETVGDIPDYAEPLDGKRWEVLIADYAHADSVLRAAQLERLQHFQPTTWTQHLQAVDAFLAQLDAKKD